MRRLRYLTYTFTMIATPLLFLFLSAAHAVVSAGTDVVLTFRHYHLTEARTCEPLSAEDAAATAKLFDRNVTEAICVFPLAPQAEADLRKGWVHGSEARERMLGALTGKGANVYVSTDAEGEPIILVRLMWNEPDVLTTIEGRDIDVVIERVKTMIWTGLKF